MFRYLVPLAALLTGSAALSADQPDARHAAEVARVLSGLTPGAPQDCINPRRITETYRLGNKIYYRFSRHEVYETDTGGGCFGLDRGDAIVSQSFSSYYCRGDILQSVDLVSHTPSGSCSYGSFVPYTDAHVRHR